MNSPEPLVASPSNLGVLASPTRTRALTPDRIQSRRPLLCPMFWSEDELSAFLVCLGLDLNIASSVRAKSLKGADSFLRMSDTELQRLGFETAVQRRVVRRSLKRFLELDRYQNAVRPRRLCEMTEDAVLREFLIPMEELQVGKEISQGGYGCVFRALFQPKAPRGKLEEGKMYVVAAKSMKGDKNMRLHELLKESRVMASLSHPNVCMFLGICCDFHCLNTSSDKQYILSELMDCSLFDLIHRPQTTNWFGDLTVLTILGLAEGFCSGIAYLHHKELVHADLKSSNILVDYRSKERLVPKICDFGHVAARSHPSPHRMCGTPHWAAPEALRSEAVGPPADVYSCGVMIWEMLARTPPHRMLSFGQVVGIVGWGGFTPDLDALPEIHPSLRSLLIRCFDFLPSPRPSVNFLQKRLRQLRHGARQDAVLMLDGFWEV